MRFSIACKVLIDALPLLVVGFPFTAPSVSAQTQDSIVARAVELITQLRDSASLHKAGYYAIGFNGTVKDLTPFQGQHWVDGRRFLSNVEPELLKPNFMMYLPLGDSLVPIGVAYSKRELPIVPMRTEFAGTPMEWHIHKLCLGVPGEGNIVADSKDDCETRGGRAGPNDIRMVHAWTIANPDGPYAHDNSALPFVATGLRAPDHAMREDRLFAVALGETYGAKLVIAHRIDIAARKEGKAHTLDRHRGTLIELVPKLRDAERAGDAKTFEALRKQAVDAWTALAEEYRAQAPTPGMRARFDVELEQALTPVHHRHGG